MKTKKEIFYWWLDRGEYCKRDDKNDYQDFYDKVDKELKVEEERKGRDITIKILRDTWKHPIYLCFYDTECYKIHGKDYIGN